MHRNESEINSCFILNLMATQVTDFNLDNDMSVEHILNSPPALVSVQLCINGSRGQKEIE